MVEFIYRSRFFVKDRLSVTIQPYSHSAIQPYSHLSIMSQCFDGVYPGSSYCRIKPGGKAYKD
jgi:hypothetical protein